MAATNVTRNVIKVAVADDTNTTTRVVAQSIYAKAAAVLTDGAGNEIADMLAGAHLQFPQGLEFLGFNVTGTGPVFIYKR